MLCILTTHTAKGHKETFGGYGYIYYLDYGGGHRCIHISKLTELYILNRHSFCMLPR